METSCIKQALVDKYTDITEHFKCDSLVPKLFEKHIITRKEKEELQAIFTTKGGIWQSEKLVDFLLTKTDVQLEDFLEILDNSNNKAIRQLIVRACSEAEAGINKHIEGE